MSDLANYSKRIKNPFNYFCLLNQNCTNCTEIMRKSEKNICTFWELFSTKSRYSTFRINPIFEFMDKTRIMAFSIFCVQKELLKALIDSKVLSQKYSLKKHAKMLERPRLNCTTDVNRVLSKWKWPEKRSSLQYWNKRIAQCLYVCRMYSMFR